MADTIDAVNPDQPPPPPPPGPPANPPPPPETVVDTMPPAIPMAEPPPPAEGCFAKRSGLEKCLITFVIIILIIAFAMVIVFLIAYFFFSPPEGTCLTDGCVKSASRLKDHMDGERDPCNSFYEYACDGWSSGQVLGPQQKKVDMDTQMNKDHFMRLRGLLDADVEPREPEFFQKPKMFYKSCVNIGKLDERGTTPFLDVVRHVGKFPALDPSWNSTLGDYNLQDIVTKLARMAIMPLFEIQVEPSEMGSKQKEMFVLSDGDLALGKKSNYADDKMVTSYKEWMLNTLQLLGADTTDAQADVDEIVDFELKLVERRRDDDVKASTQTSYNPWKLSKMNGEYKILDWLEVIQGAGASVYIGKNEVLDVQEHNYLSKLEALLDSTPKRVVANFLMSRLLPLTSNLGSDFIAHDEKYSKMIYGRDTEERWKHCAVNTARLYHDAVSRMFAEQYFTKEAKDDVRQIVDDVLTVFRDRLVNNKWMTSDTRTHALQKFSSLQTKIGYPDSLYDDEAMTNLYSDVTAKEDTFMENSVSLMRFEATENLKKSSNPAYKEGWTVSPTSMDAHYSLDKNELVLPAGFLQVPIYSTEFSSAMNYAGVASTVGRKIIHGFDQLGRLFDAEGSEEDWWVQADEDGFESQANCFLKQWSCYKWEGDSMSEDQSLGENIAYNAGLIHSYEAYRSKISRRGTEEQRLPSLKMSNNQVFFLSYAQLWCAKYGIEARREFIKTSSHPPFPYRVFGTLQNSRAFSRAFDCPVGTRMNPREKCDMW